ncbi:MAG: hypothetical protein QXU74_00835 [Candidatus Aenigmatarchaeota archaeon]
MKKSSIVVDFVAAYIILFSMLNIFPIITNHFIVDLKTFFSDIDLWSIQSYQFENFQLRLFFFVLILFLAVPKVNTFVFNQLKKIKFPKKLLSKFVLFLIISTLFFIVFFKFQTKKPIGATGVFEMMLEKDLMFINSNPLSTFFNYLLFNLFKGFMNSWSFIAFVSNISGFIFVFFLFVLSDNLYKENIKKLIFFRFYNDTRYCIPIFW